MQLRSSRKSTTTAIILVTLLVLAIFLVAFNHKSTSSQAAQTPTTDDLKTLQAQQNAANQQVQSATATAPAPDSGGANPSEQTTNPQKATQYTGDDQSVSSPPSTSPAPITTPPVTNPHCYPCTAGPKVACPLSESSVNPAFCINPCSYATSAGDVCRFQD